MKYPGKLFLILTLSMLSGSPLFAQQPAAADIPSAAEAAEERTAEEFLQNARPLGNGPQKLYQSFS